MFIMTKFKRIITISIIVINLLSVCTYADAPDVLSAAAFVEDYYSGEVLYSKDADTARVPASMTKLMTVYCVYDAIANGEISLFTPIYKSQNLQNKFSGSDYQCAMTGKTGPFTVDELLDAVLVYSACDAAYALAEYIGGGSEAEFVKRMNNKAASLGLKAWYNDSSGYTDSLISPRSMAELARCLIRDYPQVLTKSSKRYIYFHGSVYNSSNKLFSSYYYDGADGLKTGTKSTAGSCFCGTALRDGRRIISVVMNAPSQGQRFADTVNLLNYGFETMRSKYDKIYYSNMHTYIDGDEIPTYRYFGTQSQAYITAQDLENYGFDIEYDGINNILYIHKNPKKAVSPLNISDYMSKDGQCAYWINHDGKIRVIITDDQTMYEMKDVYDVGYTCISATELCNIYGYRWDGEHSASYINTGIHLIK